MSDFWHGHFKKILCTQDKNIVDRHERVDSHYTDNDNSNFLFFFHY